MQNSVFTVKATDSCGAGRRRATDIFRIGKQKLWREGTYFYMIALRKSTGRRKEALRNGGMDES